VSATALLMLHFQNDVLHDEGKIALGLARLPELRARTLAAAQKLLGAARSAALPIFHVRIAFRPDYADAPKSVPLFQAVIAAGAMSEGGWGAEFLDGFTPLPNETVLTHNRVNAFQGTPLADLLWTWRIERLILAGVASNSTVEHSARHAADLGLDVIVAQDATASARADLHAAALENIRLIGRVIPVETLIESWGAT
jgi:biuret amidohydrolase